MNPDVLLLLISGSDEWEGKITGASQGGPTRSPCHPAPRRLPPHTRLLLTPLLHNFHPAIALSLCHALLHLQLVKTSQGARDERKKERE